MFWIRIRKLISMVNWSIKRLMSRGSIDFNKGILTSSSTVSCTLGGHMIIDSYFHSEKNLKLRSDGGLIKIGKSVYMNQNVSVTSRHSVMIGDNVIIGNNVVSVDHDHKMQLSKGEQYSSDLVSIGDATWIGANVVILKGTTIGSNCVVGAGTVVKGVYEDGSIIVGVPGKVIGYVKTE